jgi:hypothetical protein
MAKDHIDEWPEPFFRVATVEQLHALGQITLIYNALEEEFGNVFNRAMPTSPDFSQRLFHNLSNRDRTDLMAAVVKTAILPDDGKAALDALIVAYDICTENRNIVMHSVGFREPGTDLLKLTKKASRGDPSKTIDFSVPLPTLRQIADDMATTLRFATRLDVWFQYHLKPAEFQRPSFVNEEQWAQTRALIVALSTLPEIPQKPHKLTKSEPPANLKAD